MLFQRAFNFDFFSLSQGMLIFLLHVVRNSDVRAEIHHQLLKWRFERFSRVSSVNRVHDDNAKCISKQNQVRGREETGNKLNHTQTAEKDTINVETFL